MTDKLLALINGKYPVTAIDTGDMGTLKASGMKFTVSAYRAEGIGHVSVMKATGFFGLMKMDTIMICPEDIDLPLYSYDRIFAMGNDTLITELYDTMLTPCDTSALEAAKAKYAHIAERDPGEHWYDSIKLSASISKKGKKAQTAELDALTEEHFKAYLALDAAAVADKCAKKEKSSTYVEGLLNNGGPSTDAFIKSLGKENTAKLFKEILFGTGK